MKLSQLKEIIRKVVSEEVARQLPVLISEIYLKGLVEQSLRPARQVAERLNATQPSGEDDDIPEQEMQDERGIYQNEVARIRSEMSEMLDPEKNPLASLYENVKPIQGGGEPLDPYDPRSYREEPKAALGETQQRFGEAGIPLNMLGMDFKRMSAAVAPKKNEEIPEDHPKMRELARKRAQLDAKKVDTSGRA